MDSNENSLRLCASALKSKFARGTTLHLLTVQYVGDEMTVCRQLEEREM